MSDLINVMFISGASLVPSIQSLGCRGCEGTEFDVNRPNDETAKHVAHNMITSIKHIKVYKKIMASHHGRTWGLTTYKPIGIS